MKFLAVWLTALAVLALLPHRAQAKLSADSVIQAISNLIKSSSKEDKQDDKSDDGAAADGLSQYGPAVTEIANRISQSTGQTNEMLKELSQPTDVKPLITREMMLKLMKDSSAPSQKPKTRSISLQAEQGFNGFSNYQPSGWVMTETVSEPSKETPQETDEKMPVYIYPMGVGPVLMNGCTAASYPKTSKCYSSKVAGSDKTVCLNLLDAAAYIGVGFDGRGFYKIESRRASLVQRYCGNLASFLGKDVPDTMNVFGIFETTAETKSFQSADEYMSYIRQKAGLSEQRNLFLSESSQHSSSTAGGMNLGAIGGIAGAAIGAYAGGPVGAALGAQLGGAIGGSMSTGSGSGTSSSSSTTRSNSSSMSLETDQASRQQGSTSNFFAIMYVNVILYEITLDEVKPKDINFAALKDYMALPVSYFSLGADVRYQNFLLRWGTHFIRSGKFGGQMKITKTAKTNKIKSSQQFASIAETEFQSMFSSLQSRRTQEKSGGGWLGLGKKTTKTRTSSSAQSQSYRRSSSEEQNSESESSNESKFTQTTVEAQGGTPEIAEALIDFYTPSFKQLFHKWIVSINDHVKPFEFQLKSIDQLFNMNMDDMFPAGVTDFGCVGEAGSKKDIKREPGTNRRYYLDAESAFVNNQTTTVMVKIYCKYDTLEDFKTDLKRRRISLEKAVAVYMAEGPFPTSTHEMAAGQPGCEQATLAQISVFSSGARSKTPTFAELKKSPFLISFDLPQELPNLLKPQAKYVVTYRGNRWFASQPGQQHAHLYDGCQLEGYKPAEKKICVWNIILTYEEDSGFFHIEGSDFVASKRRNPILPDWMAGSTVARASKLDVNGSTINADSVPCSVKWLNSHRLDPNKDENCLHFTAASAGDIFVIFSSIPRDHTTWYYLQINMDGVAFYKAMHLQKQDYQKGMGTLGDKNLYQSYFVCVNQANGSVLMQYGKADSNSEIGTVYSGYKFQQDSQYNRLSFYTFGAGSKSVSLMDIRLTKQMPKVECLNTDYKLHDGHCVLDCHKECIDCNLARDDTSCFHCRNVRVETIHSFAGNQSRVVQCVPQCPVGYELSDKSERLCVPCRPGSFKNSTGNQKCAPCLPGAFSSDEGAATCSPCSPGTFAAQLGSTVCQKCGLGTAASSNGSTACAVCSAGSFAAQLGQQDCSPCPLGQFTGLVGQSACQLCQVGYFTDKPGQRSCFKCPVGTSSAEGSMSCANNCKRGEFSPAKGVPCQKCPAGSFSSNAGSSNCTKCSAGFLQPAEGGWNCTVAPAGSYVPASGASSSVPCPVGSANPRTGGTSLADCAPCPAGSFSNATGAAACAPCQPGHYQPLTNQAACKPAGPGRFVPTEGQSVQAACPPGSISGPAATFCTPCAPNEFASRIGSKSCSFCPQGTFSGEGASTCAQVPSCPAGQKFRFNIGRCA